MISGNTHGIVVAAATATGNVIDGNRIGTNAAGTAPLSNDIGVEIESSANTIGGTFPGAGNLISGNNIYGVHIAGTTTTSNLVEGNQIGTDLTGTIAVANGIGVLFDSAPSNTIGGMTAGAGNLISGNTNRGVSIEGSFATDDLIEGNRIGTNATGTAAMSNFQGVVLESPGNIVGGTGAGAANLISGNSFQGVGIGVSATGNLVEGNEIGTNLAGTAAVPNQTGVALGSAGNTIGGTAVGAGNLLSGNSAFGVFLGESGNLVEGNRIGTDVTGTVALGNATGVEVHSSGNTIGGTAAGARNLISANINDGVFLGTDAPDDLVEGNFIGTNAVGTAALANGIGVSINAAGNTVGGTAPGAGNLISGNSAFGVLILGATTTGNLVEGNLIGTDSTGTVALGNIGDGVRIGGGSSLNTIGGPAGGARNIISGNATGIVIDGAGAGTVVAGNLIGTDASGMDALGNLGVGIVIADTSTTTIGGTTTLARNVISGNLADGLDVRSGSIDTLIQGNYIGVDQTGTQGLGNAGLGLRVTSVAGTTIGGTTVGCRQRNFGEQTSRRVDRGTTATATAVQGKLIGTDKTGIISLGNATFGVVVGDAPGVTIGGTGPGARNIISANGVAGLGIVASASGTLVEGNLIGTDITGSNPLGNGSGVLIEGGSANNSIGGTVAGGGNTIAFSAGIGVDVDATAGTGDAIRLNAIFSNAGLGIDLGGDGVTLNNSVAHTGPNDHQNFPVITAIANAAGTTNVTGTFNSTL